MFGAYVTSMSGNELSMLLNRCRLETAYLCLSSYNPFISSWSRVLPGVSKSCQEVSKLWRWYQNLCASDCVS